MHAAVYNNWAAAKQSVDHVRFAVQICAHVSSTVAMDGSMLPQGRLIKLSHQYTGAWRRAQVLFVPR